MLLALLVVIAVVFVLGAGGVALGREAWLKPVRFAPVLVGLLAVVALVYVAPRAPEGPYGKVWLSLGSLSFDLRPGQVINVGGDRENDDVVLSPGFGAAALRVGRGVLPKGFLAIRRDGDGLLLSLGAQSGDGSRALVSIGKGARRRFLGAAPAPEGLKPCPAGCQGRGARRGKIAKGRVYSAGRFDLAGADGRAVAAPGGFFFTPPKSARALAAGAGDPNYRLRKGETLGIAIWEAEPSSPARGAIEPIPGRLVLRRTATLTWTGERLNVRLDTPQTVTLDLDGAPGGRPGVRVASGAASDEPPGAGEAVAAFSLLGRSFDTDLSGVSIDVARTSADRSVVHERDGTQREIGRHAAIGGAQRVGLDVRPLDFASGIYPFLWPFVIVVLACGFGATWRLRAEDPVAALAFGAVEFLLTLRLLIAIEGAFVDAAAKTQSAVAGALIALPLGCCVALLAHPRAREFRLGAGALSAVTAAAIGLTLVTEGGLVDVAYLAVGLIAAMWAVAEFGVFARLERWLDRADDWPLRSAAFGAMAILALRFATLVAGFREGVPLGFTRLSLSLLFVPLTLIAFAPLIAEARRGWADRARARRAALVLIFALVFGVGVASRVVRDNGFAIFILPLVTAAVVALVAQPRAARDLWVDTAGAALAAAPALFGLLAWSLGAPTLAALAAMLVSLAVGLLLLWRRPAAVWLSPALAIIGLLVMVNALAVANTLPHRADDVPSRPQVDMAKAIDTETNQLRIFAALAPRRLAEVGTRGSEALQDTIAHMRAYSATLAGRGWFTLPEPTVLKAYHLTDNVSAVHLISPFGRLGALAFILVPGGLAAAAVALALRRRATPTAWLGALAALALMLPSLYMILANVLAAPFTGRNVYLLAATSSGDLLEGLLLVALVLAALGTASPAPTEPRP